MRETDPGYGREIAPHIEGNGGLTTEEGWGGLGVTGDGGTLFAPREIVRT